MKLKPFQSPLPAGGQGPVLDRPFAARPDPRFLWLGPKQAEALAVLRRELLTGGGGVLLVGAPGAGKTTLINALTAGFAQYVTWAVIGNPGPSRLDLYQALARGFALDRQFSSKVQFLLQFSAFLQSARETGKKVVLLVDDCHGLSRELLEELRLLADIARDGVGLIDICFIGRREFLDILDQPNNRPVGQRLTGRVELAPLSLGETTEYIRHRLKVAGGDEQVFAPKAIQLIHRAAAGNPRLINLICDQALQAGTAANGRAIGRQAIEQCLAQLNLPPAGRQNGAGLASGQGGLRRLLHRLAGRLPEGRRGRWVTYGLGLALLGGIGLAWLLPWTGGDPGADGGRLAIPQPAARAKVRPELSPGVGRLEPIGKAIDLGMMPGGGGAAARKKAEANKAGKQAGQASDDEAAPMAETPAGSPAAAAEDAPRDSAGPSSEASAEQVKAAPAAEARVSPMRQKRVVLPLRANSLELTEQAAKEYEAFRGELKNHPRARLLVKGFVSATTNSPGNIRLSEERAMAVQKLLVRGGIDPARITVKGMGNREPLAANDTREGRTKNRRVEIEVVDDGE